MDMKQRGNDEKKETKEMMIISQGHKGKLISSPCPLAQR